MGAVILAKVYYWRGRLYTEMSNGRSALKDWTKALKLDPSLFAAATFARLHLWQPTDIGTYVELHAECVTFLGLAHPEYSEIDAFYALLARITYIDPRLGTYDDAMEYYSNSLQATSRRFEVYGPGQAPDDNRPHYAPIDGIFSRRCRGPAKAETARFAHNQSSHECQCQGA
jgi:tetratricopeptide (TPR) repeat protein